MVHLLENAPADLGRGWSLADSGDAATALALAESVPPHHPQYADALLLRVHALRRLARQPEARPLLDEALALRPSHAPLLVEAAWLSFENQQFAAGVEAARGALACAIGDVHTAFGNNVLALNLSMLGRHDDAITAGREALKAMPDAPWMLVHQAQCLQRAGDPMGARDLAVRALALQPGNAGARAVLDATGGSAAS
jgi:tetratricopeptide (TPR) repeat protein